VAPGLQAENVLLLHPALFPVHLQDEEAALPLPGFPDQVQEGEEVRLRHRLHEVAQGGDLVARKDMLRVAGEEGDGRVPVRRPDPPCHVQAAEALFPQVDVQQEEVKGVAPRGLKEQLPAAGEGPHGAGDAAVPGPALRKRRRGLREGPLVITDGNAHTSASSLRFFNSIAHPRGCGKRKLHASRSVSGTTP
jgi:hypothetical protein